MREHPTRDLAVPLAPPFGPREQIVALEHPLVGVCALLSVWLLPGAIINSWRLPFDG
jgi:hypothetical protein